MTELTELNSEFSSSISRLGLFPTGSWELTELNSEFSSSISRLGLFPTGSWIVFENGRGLRRHYYGARTPCRPRCPHLAGGECDAVTVVVEASPVSAQEFSRPPIDLDWKLLVADKRTGKQYEFGISEEGALNASDLKKSLCLVVQLCSKCGGSVWRIITNQGDACGISNGGWWKQGQQ
ncbi:hypothetical protein KSP40_PGU011488 [Platanthera guangdongensis]|uniref:Uncharacterized protein n=1 Tax=Platanthera guangdongensis TaxID=2320717 RepID=A0ABR2MDQ6_9ASPA